MFFNAKIKCAFQLTNQSVQFPNQTRVANHHIVIPHLPPYPHTPDQSFKIKSSPVTCETLSEVTQILYIFVLFEQ